MKLYWLLSSILGILLYCSPAQAGKLLSWEFESQENRLVFTTDEGVQPQVKLLENPARLVIELPGTTLGRTTVKEKYLGAIRGFRIGQSSSNTVNLVVELAPGYTINPDEVKFNSLSPTRWTVDLPTPRIAPAGTTAGIPANPSRRNNLRPSEPLSPSPSVNRSSTNSNSRYVRATRHGFFIDLDGDRSNQIQTRRDGDTIIFDVEGITFPEDLNSQSIGINEYGVKEINFAQTSNSSGRITLQVTPDSPNWLATFSRIGGLILVPRGELPSTTETAPIARTPVNPSTIEMTTVSSIDLTNNDSELIIRSDRDLFARTQPLRNGGYEITIQNAQLSGSFQGPELRSQSPITQLKVRQEGTSVVIAVNTRLGVRLNNLVQHSHNLIAFPITVTTPKPIVNPTPAVVQPSKPPSRNRPLVVIDPGHGGQDPGTIGIGGMTEKNVILPIALDVAEELKKQGVEVRMTRDRDYFVSLEGRTDFANNIDADLFVSIHANAINLSRPDVNGLETYYYQSGRRLAEIIHWNILNSVNIENRNVRRARFYVLRHSEMPAVLVEVGFLTGADDSSRLKNPNHRQQMAKAIARGIVQYIKENRI